MKTPVVRLKDHVVGAAKSLRSMDSITARADAPSTIKPLTYELILFIFTMNFGYLKEIVLLYEFVSSKPFH
jgi:hypothetical protein